MADPKEPIDDSEWGEVVIINSYALFIGYLSMAVRGMGLLVVMWTTVVLLGGFVSMLGKKDFWSLTIITLLQTAGAFDVVLNEKLSYIGHSFGGLACSVFAMLIGKNDRSVACSVLAMVVLLVLVLVFAVILCPLAALYMCGLLITTGISLWRLIEHDYGDNAADGDAANLKPALTVLYSLALFQGVLFCYSMSGLHLTARWRLASQVAKAYGFGDPGRAWVEDYLRKTRIGCAKDPSFAKGRNLATYAVGLMMKSDESSASSFLSGARILDKLLEQSELSGQHMLIRQLIIGPASSSQVLKKLLQALDSRSPHPHDRDIRKLAARIVARLADEIRWNQFPQGIQCISSLLDTTSEQQDDNSAPSAHYKELMVQGLLILEKLAADEHNRSLISNAQGLLSKAMAPVSFDLLHRIDHEALSSIVAASLKVMCRLVTAPGETGTKLRSQMLSNKEAINSMERILKCVKCDEQLYMLAIEILTQLYEDASPSTCTASREKFIKLLVGIFSDNNKDRSIRKSAGEALAILSDQSESNATIILKANDIVVHDLSEMLLDVESSTYRISAAEILEHLYVRYTQDDDYLKKLKEAMKEVMPKVLREILLCGSTGKGKQTEKAEKQADEDIERQGGGVSQDNDRNNNTSSCRRNDDVDEQHVDRKLQAALLSLSAAKFDKWISEDKDLAKLVDRIAPGDSAFSFAGKLKEMVERNNKPTADCLRIMKITSRMVISMIKHNESYVKANLGLMQSLSDASKNMLDLEGFMIFSSSDHDALKPVSTLASLVKEAQELLD